jgi:hypothetical protein
MNKFSFQIEKNSIVEIFPSPLIEKNCININIPPNNQVTLNELLQNAEKIHPYDFWLYDATNNNCQEFINSLLDGSRLNTPEAKIFLYQNAKQLFEDLGFSGKVVKQLLLLITNLGARLSNLYYMIFN